MQPVVPFYVPSNMAYKVGSVIQKDDYRFEWIVRDPFSNLWLRDGELQSPSFSFANACFTVLLKKKRPLTSQLSWITACVKNGTLHSLLRVQVKLGIVGKDGKEQDIQTGDMDGREFWVHNWILALLMKKKMVNQDLTIFCELQILDESVQTTSLTKTPQSKADLAKDSTENFRYLIIERLKVSKPKANKDEPRKKKENSFSRMSSIGSFQPEISKDKDEPRKKKENFFSNMCSIGDFQPQISKEIEWEPWIPTSELFTDEASNWFCDKMEAPKLQGKVKPTEDNDSFSCLEKAEGPTSKSKATPAEDVDLFTCLEKVECLIPKSKLKPSEDDNLFSCSEKVGCSISKNQVLPTEDKDPLGLIWTEEDLDIFRPRSQVQVKEEEDTMRLFWSEEEFEGFGPKNEVQTENKAEDKDVGSCSVEKVETSISKGVDKVLQGLKGLLASEEQSDVILKLKGKCFKAHKLILSMRSPVFHSMFEHDMVEKETGEVNIDDCDPEIFPDFLSYLYTGSVDNLAADNVFSLYSVADKYCVDEMKEECVECMRKILSADTFCDVLTLALGYSEKELIERVPLFSSRTK